MKIRTQPNFDRNNPEKEIFGLSIMLDKGRKYCKYPIGHQEYKSLPDAAEAAVKLQDRIKNGAHIEYGTNGTAGVNKAEYVKIVDNI